MDPLLTTALPTKRWFRPGRRAHQATVIMGIILLSAGTAFLAEPARLALVLGVLVGLGAVSIFLRWPPMGIAVLVIGSLIVPSAVATGTQTSLNVTVLLLPLLAVLWLFGTFVREKRIALVRSRTIGPLLVFVLLVLLAFGAGQLPWFAFVRGAPLRAQLGGLSVFLLSAAAFFLAANQITEPAWLQRLTWLFLVLGGVHIGGRFVPLIGSLIEPLFPRGALGSGLWIWLVSLSSSQAIFNRSLPLRWRIVLLGLVVGVFNLNLIQAEGWVSGWLPPLIALLTVVAVGAPKAGLVLGVLGVPLAIAKGNNLYAFLIMGDNQYSFSTRLEAWRIISEIVKVNPLLGFGPANYYWYTPLFPILGYYVRFNSHNNFVDIVAQAGILGLIAFLWFVFEVGRLGWVLRNQVPEGFPKAYVLGVLGGLVGTLSAGMLGDWILPFIYNIGLAGMRSSILGWLFMGGLVALQRVSQTSSDDLPGPGC